MRESPPQARWAAASPIDRARAAGDLRLAGHHSRRVPALRIRVAAFVLRCIAQALRTTVAAVARAIRRGAPRAAEPLHAVRSFGPAPDGRDGGGPQPWTPRGSARFPPAAGGRLPDGRSPEGGASPDGGRQRHAPPDHRKGRAGLRPRPAGASHSCS